MFIGMIDLWRHSLAAARKSLLKRPDLHAAHPAPGESLGARF